jgi:IMP dehydrogenase|tara:strand:+ start:171 stop:1322 length:1152 start_codon:yes stop_codon:yes gene_type:complete
MKESLTYDDVNIVPKYSEVESRRDVDLTSRLTKNRYLNVPLVSSPMDTITEYEMAYMMWNHGGVGFIHRFMEIETQAKMVSELKSEIESSWVGTKHLYENLDEEIENTNSPAQKLVLESMKGTKAWFENSPLGAAIGVTGDYLERAQELVSSGCNVILLDIAHGHHKLVKEGLRRLKNEVNGKFEIIAGCVATALGAKDLCEWGADGLRVGIGNGSLCETRIRTGVGIPQVTALLDCVTAADTYNCPTIADGGVRYIGDVCKGLACGADSVMLGSLLSGTKETPGDISKVGKWPNEQLFKKYRGSASFDSKIDRGESENVEGNSRLIPYKGKVRRIMGDIKEGIKSSCSYVGATNLDEFRSLAEFIKVTEAGQVEAKAHLLDK